MPVFLSATTLRSIATWLLFAGAVAAALVSGAHIALAVDIYGAQYPSSLSPNLPAFSKIFLSAVDHLVFLLWTVVSLAVLSVFWTVRVAGSRQTREHVVTLIAAFLYHLVLMTWMAFVIGFFVLPQAKAGI